MVYIRTYDAKDNLTGAERLEAPAYVRWQSSNGLLVRCEREQAQGVVSADGSTVYLIDGQMPRGEREPYAVFIDVAEYESIAAEDPEDDAPETREDAGEAEVLTRAELTARLQEQAETISMLTECIMEMSEAVYA